MERESDVRRVMELTDPKYVWLTTDTGHLTLGGMDAVKIMSDYFPRIAEVHLKDTYAKYRGNTSTPTQEQHKVASVYHNMGGGGVDFPAVFKLLRDRHYKGWAIFDMDGPRKGDDGFDAIGGNLELAIDDYLSHNVNYMRVILGDEAAAVRLRSIACRPGLRLISLGRAFSQADGPRAGPLMLRLP